MPSGSCSGGARTGAAGAGPRDGGRGAARRDRGQPPAAGARPRTLGPAPGSCRPAARSVAGGRGARSAGAHQRLPIAAAGFAGRGARHRQSPPAALAGPAEGKRAAAAPERAAAPVAGGAAARPARCDRPGGGASGAAPAAASPMVTAAPAPQTRPQIATEAPAATTAPSAASSPHPSRTPGEAPGTGVAPAETAAAEAAAAAESLPELWQRILAALELPSTRMLLSQQAHLARLDERLAVVRVAGNWISMVQTRLPLLETAVARALGSPRQVTLEAGEQRRLPRDHHHHRNRMPPPATTGAVRQSRRSSLRIRRASRHRCRLHGSSRPQRHPPLGRRRHRQRRQPAGHSHPNQNRRNWMKRPNSLPTFSTAKSSARPVELSSKPSDAAIAARLKPVVLRFRLGSSEVVSTARADD